MDVPRIDSQVRRDVGAAADATDFGSVHWAVREGDPGGAEQTLGLAVFDAGKGNVEHVHTNCEERRSLPSSEAKELALERSEGSTSSKEPCATRWARNRRSSARAT